MQIKVLFTLFLPFLTFSIACMGGSLRNRKNNTNKTAVVYMKKLNVLKVHNLLNNGKKEPNGENLIPIDRQIQKQMINALSDGLQLEKSQIEQEYKHARERHSCNFCLKISTSCCCGCMGGGCLLAWVLYLLS